MNKKHLYCCTMLMCLLSMPAIAQNQLSGRVYDPRTLTSLPYASIYIEDLKLGAVSDSAGQYQLKNIPAGSYVVNVRLLGYATKSKSVNVKGAVALDFPLISADYEEQEIVVTGNAIATNLENTPQPVTEVPNSYLMQNASTNIIDALSHIPGVSGITDGQSIAKPVIRGLGYNRVVTINDGVRQEGQQWGDEFGIEVDPYSVDRVEILKGPASLIYGSDAISGVINFLPEKTLPEGAVRGDVTGGYQTNNGLFNGAAHIAGNLNGITFSARVDNTLAHAYQNKEDGYVFNSQFNNFNTDGTAGIHRKWGFSQLHYSYFELRTGIVEGAKDSATGMFTKQSLDGSGNPVDQIATNQELRSYTPFVINQLVKHNKLVWDNSIAVGQGRIIARFAYQQNSRQENNDITIPNTANIWYLLKTANYDVRYVSPSWNNFEFTAGTNGMYQDSKNKGTLLLIPEYNLFDIGGFAIANKTFGRVTISGGVRYDNRMFRGHDDYTDSNGNQLSASDPAALHKFTAYTSNYNGISASLGATWHISDNFYLKGNAARGFRAPNVAESGSNGIHDGTVVYEIGTHNLKPENSLEFDLTPGFRSKDLTIELSPFYNYISNFIYARQLGDSVNNSTIGFPAAPVFLYTQADARLIGGEAMADIHPSAIKWLSLYAGYSIVGARLQNVPDSVKYIPFVPPSRLRAELTATCKHISNTFTNAYARFGINHTFEKTEVYQQYNVYNDVPGALPSTPAYTLLNAGLGTDIMGRDGRKTMSIYVSGDNLSNISYVDYMSRLRYYNGNGVHNMGRNISFRVIVPLDFSPAKKTVTDDSSTGE